MNTERTLCPRSISLDFTRCRPRSSMILSNYSIPELNQFISRTPALGAYNEARLIFHRHEALVSLHQSNEQSGPRIEVQISCQVSDWQLSSLAQICTLSLHLFSTMENLHIDEARYSPPNWKDDIENTE